MLHNGFVVGDQLVLLDPRSLKSIDLLAWCTGSFHVLQRLGQGLCLFCDTLDELVIADIDGT